MRSPCPHALFQGMEWRFINYPERIDNNTTFCYYHKKQNQNCRLTIEGTRLAHYIPEKDMMETFLFSYLVGQRLDLAIFCCAACAIFMFMCSPCSRRLLIAIRHLALWCWITTFCCSLTLFPFCTLKGYLENTEKDRIRRLIRLKPPSEFWTKSFLVYTAYWRQWWSWLGHCSHHITGHWKFLHC